jgi:uncharacterized protein YdeI (YjbR/CyaY-like superfamily)
VSGDLSHIMALASAAAIYFESALAFRQWLEEHHASAAELLVGYHKRHTGRLTLTWPESVDEALCFGWIDGIRRSVDAERYTIRFTPRRRHSVWSLINVGRVAALIEEGRMRPAGVRAFEHRRADRTGVASFERPLQVLAPAEIRQFKQNKPAWAFWESQPPGYRKTATHWVVSAKRPETRATRLGVLIDDSGAGQRIALLRRPGKPTA